MRTKLSVTWIRYIFVYLHVSYTREFQTSLVVEVYPSDCMSVSNASNVLLFTFDWKTEEPNSMKLCKTKM